MKIKEIKITTEGYEVTLAWTTKEVNESTGTKVDWFLQPRINLLELIAEDLKRLKERGEL